LTVASARTRAVVANTRIATGIRPSTIAASVDVAIMANTSAGNMKRR
jgi:hypothetical protein